MSAFTKMLTFHRRAILRVFVGVYIFPFSLVCFSLSVPPADLPLCLFLFLLAAAGFILARRESRAWRIFWIVALLFALVSGVLEVIAGSRIAHQRSAHAAMRNDLLLATPVFAILLPLSQIPGAPDQDRYLKGHSNVHRH
jgi:hypothetical protein